MPVPRAVRVSSTATGERLAPTLSVTVAVSVLPTASLSV